MADIPTAARLLLHGGSVLDVESGEVSSADVVVVGERIADVGPGLDGDEAVDCSGLTLLPGLIDCHAHMAFTGLAEADRQTSPSLRLLRAVSMLRATLRLGVTTVRDAWGADAGLRDAIDAGHIPGPRLLVSLAQLSGTGGIGDHFDLGAGLDPTYLGTPWLPRGVFDGPDQARGAVRRMLRSGADVIKVAATGSVTQGARASAQQVADDELAEIVAEARRWNVHVMAHAHGARAAEAAARAGARSIEHGTFLDEQAVGVMAELGTWLVPTLLPSQQDAGEDAPEWLLEARHASARAFRLALDAGVPIAMGTDCPVAPHERRLEELEHMHRLGMSRAQVWRASTLEAARLLGRHDLGLLQPGRCADIVAIADDPWNLAGLDKRVRKVWKDGLAAK